MCFLLLKKGLIRDKGELVLDLWFSAHASGMSDERHDQMTNTDTFMLFFGLTGIDVVYYLKHKPHLTCLRSLIQRDDTGSTCNCTAKGPAVSATLTHHYKTAFCVDSVSALIVSPFPQSGNRQQRNTAIFILGVYCKCHSQRVEVSKFGTKLRFEASTLLFRLIRGPSLCVFLFFFFPYGTIFVH